MSNQVVDNLQIQEKAKSGRGRYKARSFYSASNAGQRSDTRFGTKRYQTTAIRVARIGAVLSEDLRLQIQEDTRAQQMKAPRQTHLDVATPSVLIERLRRRRVNTKPTLFDQSFDNVLEGSRKFSRLSTQSLYLMFGLNYKF